MFKQRTLAIAIIAGLAAGLMALAGLRPSPIAMALLIAAPAAIYIASLGWGNLAGVVAAAIAASAALAWHGAPGFVIAGGLLFFPAALAGHLANLGQPDAAGKAMIWFPLSGILLALMAAIGIAFVVAGFALDYQPAAVSIAFKALFKELIAANAGLEVPPEAMLEQSAAAYTKMLPAVIPGVWLLVHVLVMHFSAMITARSGLLARPAEDIAANTRLPAAALVIPLAGLAGMAILASPFAEICAVAAGIGIAGFALTGIAELHLKTRGWPGRAATLFFAYFLLIVFGLPAIIFAIMGAARSLRNPVQNRPPSAPADRGNNASKT